MASSCLTHVVYNNRSFIELQINAEEIRIMTRLINAEAIQYSSDIADTIKPDDFYHSERVANKLLACITLAVAH